MRVGLTFNEKTEEDPGGPFPTDEFLEWDDAETIQAIADALRRRHEVVLVEAGPFCAERLKEERPDIVFNIAEGRSGPFREAEIPALLEDLGLPYTGSGPDTLSIALDKGRTNRLLKRSGVPTPDFLVCDSPHVALNGLRFPLIVKPLWEGSSKGIPDSAVVDSRQALDEAIEHVQGRYHQPALVESYLDGREFTIALLGNGEDLCVLPIVEIDFEALPRTARRIYSYEAKWVWDTPTSPLQLFVCPAKIPETFRRRLEAIAKEAFRVLKCRDWCRIDVRLDQAGEPRILEVNPLPGILPRPEQNSCFPKAARAAGLSYEDLIEEVLQIACKRYGLKDARTDRRPVRQFRP